jgi:hypothetical protein
MSLRLFKEFAHPTCFIDPASVDDFKDNSSTKQTVRVTSIKTDADADLSAKEVGQSRGRLIGSRS